MANKTQHAPPEGPFHAMQMAYPGDTLLAPGILRNPIEVESFYDPQAARRATLRNLLQREGYDSLDDVRAESEAKGKMAGEAKGLQSGKNIGRVLALKEAVYQVITAKGWSVSQTQRQIIERCDDVDQLKGWLSKASTARSIATLYPEQSSGTE